MSVDAVEASGSDAGSGGPVPGQPAGQARVSTRFKVLLVCVLGGGLCAALGAFLLFVNWTRTVEEIEAERGATPIGQAFVDALEAGRVEDARTLTFDELRRRPSNEERLAETLGILDDLGPPRGRDVVLAVLRHDDERFELVLDAAHESGRAFWELELVQVGDRWRVRSWRIDATVVGQSGSR